MGVNPVRAVSFAETLSTKKAQLQTVQSKISAVDQNLDQLQAKQQQMQRQLAEIDKKYALIAEAVLAYQEQIEDNNKQIDDTQKAIKRQTLSVKKQKNSLDSQLKASYVMGRHDRLKLLLNQKDPALSSRILVYYEYLNKMRVKKIAQLDDDIKQLDRLESEFKTELASLKTLQQERQAEQDKLLSLKQERTQLLAQINRQMSSGTLALNQLKEDEQHLKALIANLPSDADAPAHSESARPKLADATDKPEHEKAAVLEDDKTSDAVEDDAASVQNVAYLPSNALKNNGLQRGRLPWPVSGKLLKQYGSPKLDGRWNGVLISASEGHPVRAVANGKIVYSGWLRGYGMMTIINHGSGVMSIYAFNQSLYKRVGDRVKSGDMIATVGQSGGQATPGLYFEIRQQGNPIDPNTWCKK